MPLSVCIRVVDYSSAFAQNARRRSGVDISDDFDILVSAKNGNTSSISRIWLRSRDTRWAAVWVYYDVKREGGV